MNFNDFQKILWQQKPSGEEGFEGLVAKLLERLTGQRFYLSLSGRQEGKDMSSSGQRGNLLAVECKRYEDSTSLKSDELLAKFSAAGLSSSPPDLWMVVTTKRLGEQHHGQLKLASQKFGIAYFSIDAEEDENSFLCALCANAPDIVASHLNNSELKVYLESLKDIQAQIKRLKQELLAENIGYADCRNTQNTWLSEQLRDEKKSRATFGQNLAVSSQGESLIPRKKAFETMEKWWCEWSSNHKHLILLGEEGDGKTWAVAAWLNDYLKHADFPPTLFISATQVETEEPLNLITKALKRQLSEPRPEYWEKRLQYWLKRAASSPVFLLVLDGLNERPSFQWASLFSKLALDENQIAVLATCRSVFFWENSLSGGFNSSSVPPWTLEPYDDKELALALKHKNLKLDQLDKQLHPLLCKPRYFDLTVKLRSRLSDEGEITIERLIYEDQRDKYSRKHGASQLLTHEDFQEFISNLAEQWKPNKSLTRKQVAEELSGYGDEYSSRMEELITSGILIKKGNRWEIDRRSLILGLGLLLAYDVEEVANQTETEIAEVVAHHLEPQSDMDIKVSICGMALYHSMVQDNFPEVGRLVLFQSWINGRNISEDDWRRVPAYLPMRPETYLTMAERLWSLRADNHQAQEIFMYGFLKYKNIEKVKKALIPAFQRWMGFVFPDGHVGRHVLEHDEKGLIESQQAVREALGQKVVVPGAVSLFGYLLNVIEDEGLLRLAKVVLAVISQKDEDRVPHCQAIVTGVIAGTVMGYPDFQEKLAWVLRTAPNDIETLLLEATNKLLQHSEATAQKSAWWLLSALGTEKAFALRTQIPKEFPFKNVAWQLHEENPCRFGLLLWSRDNYIECLKTIQFHPDAIARNLKEVALDPGCTVPDWLPERFMCAGEGIDLNQVRSGGGMSTSEDTNFETLEPALCAYQPSRYAELLRILARQLPNRPADSRHRLGWLLYEHILVMGEEEQQAIDEAWRKSIMAGKQDENEVHAEEILFPCVLRGRDLQKQLQFIEERDGRSSFFSDYPPFLKKIEPQFLQSVIETLKRLRTKGQHYNLLYHLSCALPCFDNSMRELILDIFHSDGNSRIRSHCLEIIVATKDPEAIQAILTSHWKAEPNHKNKRFENYWGSRLLCEFGQTLPFSEIIDRVSPELLGYAVQQRGNVQEEVLAYAEVLHRIWSAVVAKTLQLPVESEFTEVKLDLRNQLDEFPIWSFGDGTEEGLKFISWDSVWGGSTNQASSQDISYSMDMVAQQRRVEEVRQRILLLVDEHYKSGNPWFMDSFKQDALSEVVEACPQLVKQWLEAVLAGNQSSRSIMAYCRSFYEVLCRVLLQKQPEQGCNLFKRLYENNSFRIVDSTTGIQSYLFSLFEVESSVPVNSLRKELMDMATQDMELFELAFLAQLEKKHDWLNDVISGYLNSRWPFEIGLGVRLLGFLDTPSTTNQLSSWIEGKPDSWLRDIAKRSQRDYQKNQWARHWFGRFITHEDDFQAWAAFRLFLQCVDRRFWLWGRDMLTRESIKPQRLEHYQAYDALIRKAAKENEEKALKLKKQLIGCEVYDGQLWPWMRFST